MPNPVAANDLQPISGSLQTSRVSYGVETAGKNYGQNYNSTTWYSDIPNNGQFYTIISDNYTANYYNSRSLAEGAYVEGGLPAVDEYSAPVFWTTVGTSSLDVITIVNGLPDRIGQTPFVSGAQALNWVASSSNYFAVGPDYYDQIDADNLGLYVHGNQVISYPTTGSSWYDISGQNNRFDLRNGPTYNSSGWINFDGSDDYAPAVNTTLPSHATSSFTLMAVARTNSGTGYQTVLGTGGLFSQIGFVSANSFVYGRNAGGGGLLYTNGGTITTGRFYHLTMTYNGSTATAYLNGVATQTGVNIGSNGGTNGVNVLSSYTPSTAGEILTGDIAEAYVYTQALSAAEIAQNYYGGPIVTGSISGSYQAGNLVSYASGSTATYNMAANIISGSLQNGVAFNPTNGGYWSFDGTDDLILLEGSTTNAWILNSGDTWTVNAWVRTPSGSFGSAVDGGYYYGPILSNTNGGPIYSTFQINGGTIAYTHYNGGWLTKYGTTVVNDGNWHLLTWVNSSNSMTFYVDSIPNGTVASNISGVGWLDTIGSAVGNYFIGDIASVQINQGKAFTAAEVLQQYNATK
jgi:hypothetical protein